jgi:hypothetical protein
VSGPNPDLRYSDQTERDTINSAEGNLEAARGCDDPAESSRLVALAQAEALLVIARSLDRITGEAAVPVEFGVVRVLLQ